MKQRIVLRFCENKTQENAEIDLSQDVLVKSFFCQMESWSVSSISESKVVPFVGGGSLECLINNKWELICTFSNTYIEAFGEFSKFLNYTIKTKTFDYDAFRGVNACKKCDKILPKNVSICPYCGKASALVKAYLEIIKPHTKKIVIAMFFVCIFVFLRAITPVITANFIDDMIARGGIASISEILQFLFITLSVLIGALIADQITEQTMLRANTGVEESLKVRCFEQIHNISLNSFSLKDTGQYFNLLKSSTKSMRKLTRDLFLYHFSTIVRLILTVVIMFVFSPTLALIAVLPAPIMVVLMAFFQLRMRKFYIKQSRANIHENQVVHDLVSGIRVIKAFGKEKQSCMAYEQACLNSKVIAQTNEKKWISVFTVFQSFVVFVDIGILMLAGSWVLDGTISLGTLLLFIIYLPKYFRYVRTLSRSVMEINTFKVEMSKIMSLLNIENEIVFTVGAEFPAIQGEIEFRNVSFGYNSYDLVLKNISFVVKKGEMLGLVGHSGSGKSTIINLLLRLYDVTSGEILIDGIPINQIPKTFLQKSFGTVFQERFLFNDTVFNNVKYTYPNATTEQVIAACKAANVHDTIASLPLGYESLIGERGSQLSGGEKQRLVIARAILPSPSILILDEATSALDVESEKAFMYSVLICLGQTAVFVVLGVLAGTLGTFMGVAGLGRVWTILLFGLLVFMGLEFLGVTNVLNSADSCGTKTTTKKGIIGALIVGVLSALFSSPCSTPVLVAMLSYVSAGGLSWWIGGLMLLSYSLGHSILLILAGTSVDSAKQLSSSKKFETFSKVFKIVFALFMFGMALYFMLTAFYL